MCPDSPAGIRTGERLETAMQKLRMVVRRRSHSAIRAVGGAAAVMGAVWAVAYWKVVTPIYAMKPTTPGKPSPDNQHWVKELFAARRVAFVGAHPDDIEWWGGATAHVLAGHGVQVRLILATRGDKGLPLVGWLREKAQMEAASDLGADVVFLDGFKDRKLNQHPVLLKEKLRAALDEFHPDVVFCWDPRFMTNRHPDHIAVGRTCAQIQGPWQRIYYGTRHPNLWVPYDDQTRTVKLAALAAHRTEYPPLLWQRAKAFQTMRFTAVGRQIGAPNAEPFRIDTQSGDGAR